MFMSLDYIIIWLFIYATTFLHYFYRGRPGMGPMGGTQGTKGSMGVSGVRGMKEDWHGREGALGREAEEREDCKLAIENFKFVIWTDGHGPGGGNFNAYGRR
jgi:hypothetical protein